MTEPEFNVILEIAELLRSAREDLLRLQHSVAVLKQAFADTTDNPHATMEELRKAEARLAESSTFLAELERDAGIVALLKAGKHLDDPDA